MSFVIGLPRAKLVAHYLAMDVGVVTPIKDGMNLVAKEMLICNPAAALILSSGAGTEVQLGNAGFYAQDKQCYYRVEDVTNIEVSMVNQFPPKFILWFYFCDMLSCHLLEVLRFHIPENMRSSGNSF